MLFMIALKHFLGFLFAGTGLAGMRQRDLIQWYVAQQNEKNSYSSMEEAAIEVSKIKAIIEVNQTIILHPTKYYGVILIKMW